MTEEKKEELKPEETQTDKAPSVEETKDAPKDDLQSKLEEEQAKREELEASLAKTEEERDNYRQGMLSAKAKKISLSGDDEEVETPVPAPQPQPVQPKVDDETGWDEVDKRAEAKANAIYTTHTKKQEKENERIALKKFMTTHPELVSNDATMQAVVEEYSNKHGKSIEGIGMDLDRAYKYYKLDNNISEEPTVENKAAKDLASQPTPQGTTPANVSGFNDYEQKYIQNEFEGNVDKFKAYKQAIIDGTIEVPKDIVNSLS